MSNAAPAQPKAASSEGPRVTPATFADMRLKVGDLLPVESQAVVAQRGATVGVLGWLEGVSIMTTLPRDASGRVPVDPGDLLTLRAFTGKSAFAFRAQVLRVAYQPFAYMHLRFPEQVDAVHIRRSYRHRTHLDATVQGHGPLGALGDEQPASILNVGTTGALIGARTALGERVEAVRIRTSFELHGVPVSLDLRAAVRSVGRVGAGEDALHQYGVEFTDLSANDRLVLGSLLWFEMHERPTEAV